MIKNNQYNIGYICTTQQCAEGRKNKVAMRWINSSLGKTDFTFDDLDKKSNCFANVLQKLGFEKGDVFFTFLPKAPEQFFAFLGTLKAQAIAGTLFANFGEESLLDRLGDSRAKGIITKKSLYKKVWMKHLINLMLQLLLPKHLRCFTTLQDQQENQRAYCIYTKAFYFKITLLKTFYNLTKMKFIGALLIKVGLQGLLMV